MGQNDVDDDDNKVDNDANHNSHNAVGSQSFGSTSREPCWRLSNGRKLNMKNNFKYKNPNRSIIQWRSNWDDFKTVDFQIHIKGQDAPKWVCVKDIDQNTIHSQKFSGWIENHSAQPYTSWREWETSLKNSPLMPGMVHFRYIIDEEPDHLRNRYSEDTAWPLRVGKRWINIIERMFKKAREDHIYPKCEVCLLLVSCIGNKLHHMCVLLYCLF